MGIDDDLPPWITVERVAGFLDMPESWVYRLCRTFRKYGRGIPNKQFGRAVRIPRGPFLEWVDTQ